MVCAGPEQSFYVDIQIVRRRRGKMSKIKYNREGPQKVVTRNRIRSRGIDGLMHS
jgi:hypothetical protein